jgi:4-hydroxybenzoate polyprenyltransferase
VPIHSAKVFGVDAMSHDLDFQKNGSGLDQSGVATHLERDIIQSDLNFELFALILREAPEQIFKFLFSGINAIPVIPFHARALRYDRAKIDALKNASKNGLAPKIETDLPKAWADAILDHIGLNGKTSSTTTTEMLTPGKQTNGFKAIAKALRLHQWLKNLLVFIPILMAHQVWNTAALLSTILAFLCFGLVASSIYILNDLMDLHQDRRHETKRNRPFASGALSVRTGLMILPFSLGGAFLIANQLPAIFSFVMLVYVTMNLGYTFYLKRKLLVDVLSLSGAYTLRILAGNAAASIDVSNWLLAFSVFLFLSLALVKRYVELDTAEVEDNVKSRVMGRGYRKSDLEMISQLGVSSGFSSVVVLAVFIDNAGKSGLYRHSQLIWLIAPIVLYVIGRIWMLAKRGEMNDDPIMFIIKDWRSHLMAVIVAMIIYLAI